MERNILLFGLPLRDLSGEGIEPLVRAPNILNYGTDEGRNALSSPA